MQATDVVQKICLSLEHEVPPLDFIPQYLGVMLVSYRRVPKSSQPVGDQFYRYTS